FAAGLVLVVAAAAVLLGSAAAAKPVRLTVWLPFEARELGVLKQTIAEYDAKHPEVEISVAGAIPTAKIVASIRAGNAPDVAMDFESANVGTYCSTGSFVDLAPYIARDHVDLGNFTAASRYYTQYRGVR